VLQKAAFSTLEMLDALKDNVIFDDDGVRSVPSVTEQQRRGLYDPRLRRDLESATDYRL
jgi:hypothetical protein